VPVDEEDSPFVGMLKVEAISLVGFVRGGTNGPTGDLVRIGCSPNEAAGSL
jgi:hypothetical protein